MPYITFPDGISKYIPNKDPKTIEKAKAEHALEVKSLSKGKANVLGDVGRQTVAGVQQAVRGVAETGASVYDLFTDEDLTKDVGEYFDKIAVGEAETTQGQITRYLVQFGLPGFGVAGVLNRFGKMNKVTSALGGGLADGAVATDDVDTLKDIFIDQQSESDQARLARLNGAEAASERLKNKLEVAAEGAGFILGLPLALKATKETIYGASDLLAPGASVVAKGLTAAKGGLKPNELQKTAFDANQNTLKKWFTLLETGPTN